MGDRSSRFFNVTTQYAGTINSIYPRERTRDCSALIYARQGTDPIVLLPRVGITQQLANPCQMLRAQWQIQQQNELESNQNGLRMSSQRVLMHVQSLLSSQ